MGILNTGRNEEDNLGSREETEISLVRVRLLPPLPMNEGGYRRPAVRDKVEEGLYGKEDEGL